MAAAVQTFTQTGDLRRKPAPRVGSDHSVDSGLFSDPVKSMRKRMTTRIHTLVASPAAGQEDA